MTDFEKTLESITRPPYENEFYIRYLLQMLYRIRVSSLTIPYKTPGDVYEGERPEDKLLYLAKLLHIPPDKMLSINLGELFELFREYLREERSEKNCLDAVYCLLHYFIPYYNGEFDRRFIICEMEDINILREYSKICASDLLDINDDYQRDFRSTYDYLCSNRDIQIEILDEVSTILFRVYDTVEDIKRVSAESNDNYEDVDELLIDEPYHDQGPKKNYDAEESVFPIVRMLLLDPVLDFYQFEEPTMKTAFERILDSI